MVRQSPVRLGARSTSPFGPEEVHMRSTLTITSVIAALLTSAPLYGQEAHASAGRFTLRPLPCCELEAATVPDATPVGLMPAAERRTRSFAFWGGVAGAVAGGVWGYALHASADDWVGPPAFVFTVPVGVLTGALAGAALGALTNRDAQTRIRRETRLSASATSTTPQPARDPR